MSRVVSRVLSKMKKLESLMPHEIPAPAKPVPKDVEDLHQLACINGLDTYADPSTGYQVFTALSHLRRGKCCGSACWHCPYLHSAVKSGSASKWKVGTGVESGAEVNPSPLSSGSGAVCASSSSVSDSDSASACVKME